MNIEQTISFYLDSALTSEQEAEFHHLLSVSPEARTLFREHMALQSVARDERTLVTPEEGLRSSLFASLAAEGMSVDAMPMGGTAYGTTAPAVPAVVAEPSFEAFEEAPELTAPAATATVAEMRAPRTNQRGEEKRRRRLLPFLIPTLLLAVAASALLFDLGGDEVQTGTPVLAEARTEATTEATTEAVSPVEKPSAVPEISAPVVATDRGQAPARAERRPVLQSRSRNAAPTSRAVTTQPQSREEASSPVAPVAPIVRSDAELEGGLAYSIPPSTEMDGLSSDELLASSASVQTINQSPAKPTENLDDYGRGYASVAKNDDSFESIALPEELSLTNAMVGRDPNALEDLVDDRKGFLATLTDENGNTIESTLENKDAILKMLRGEGIAINPDGTFTIASNNVGELAANDGASSKSKAEKADEEIGSTKMPAYFVAVEGNFATAVAEAQRALEWYMERPDDLRGDVATDLMVKGGMRLGEESPLMILAVAGFSEYGERTTTYNGAAMSPIPPVIGNEINAGREFWVGTGGRYTLELGSKLSAGAEVILGVGEERFHANLSAPIALKLTRAIAFEIIPTLSYRNAHAPIRATTGTSSLNTVLQGPAHDEEWRVGAGVGFLFLLW